MPVPILSIMPYPGQGGPAIQHLTFLETLDPARYEVHAAIPANHPLRERYERAAVKVHELDGVQLVPRSPARVVHYWLASRALARRIEGVVRAEKIRLVHTFCEALPAASRGAKRAGVPAVVHVIGLTIFEPPWVARLYCGMLRRVADRLVCCQDRMAKQFERFRVPPAMLRVVYNAVDGDAIRSEAESAAPPDLPAGTLSVGMVAGMDRRKGHLTLVRAAPRVLETRPDVHFYLVGNTEGDTEYRDEIRATIASLGMDDRVHLTGMVDHSVAWIGAMDVYCIPSRIEALSVAGMEAMALGRPIVATDVGGNPITVADGTTGLLSRADDPEDLADKLLVLLGDESKRQSFGEHGRSRLEEKFTIGRNAERLSAVFDELITG